MKNESKIVNGETKTETDKMQNKVIQLPTKWNENIGKL